MHPAVSLDEGTLTYNANNTSLFANEHRNVGVTQHAEADRAEHAANRTQTARTHADQIAFVALGCLDDGLDRVDAVDHFNGKVALEILHDISHISLELLVALFSALLHRIGEIFLGNKRNAHAETSLIEAAEHKVLRRRADLSDMDRCIGVAFDHLHRFTKRFFGVIGSVVRNENISE